MAEERYEDLFEHAHDGIREYDNPLPGWWTWIFWVCVFFSIGYWAWYHIGQGASVEQQYEADVAAYFEKQLEKLGELNPDNATVVRLMNNTDMMTAMSGLFRGNCGQCHEANGGGNIGPNLTDDSYKNITEPADFVDVIANGIAGTSMPAWKQRLREPQIILLAAYVSSLRGTNVSGGKPAEGIVIPPWPTMEQIESETGADNPAPDS